MPIKLIENMCTKDTKKTINTQKPKKLKESYDYRDFDIRQADEVLEGMMGNASDEYIDKTIRIPMRPVLRSLNLSNSVCIIAYEILRQIDFEGLQGESQYFD